MLEVTLTHAAALLTDTSITQMSKIVQRLFFNDWRACIVVLRLNPGQRALHVLRYTIGWR